MKIKLAINEKKGAFYIEHDHIRVAEMTFSQAGSDKIIIDHTEVDESLKGKGIGYRLVEEAVYYARENQIKIIPLYIILIEYFIHLLAYLIAI